MALEGPSPSSSQVAQPNLKRARVSSTQANPSRQQLPLSTASIKPRPKRQKAERAVDQDSVLGSGAGLNGRLVNQGAVKGREEEWVEPGDIQTNVSLPLL